MIVLGIEKKRRKAKLHRKRLERKRQGKIVPFTLSNCPKKLRGIKNSYQYKINVHKCCFNDAEFNRVRYRAGHITYSYFRRSNFNNVDFIFVNLKKTNFEGAKFNRVVFNGCNLENVNFDEAIFVDTYFINCKIDAKLKEKLSKKAIVINVIDIDLSKELENRILLASENKKLEKYHILTINSKKANKAMLQILLTKFTESQVIKFINKATLKQRHQFFTLHDYMESLENYYQKC